MEVVDTCCQLIRVVGMGLHHSMADVQSTVQFGGIVIVSTPLIQIYQVDDMMHCANNVAIMQTLQLGQIKVLKEKVHTLDGCVQDLEHKLAEQDHIIANLVGDNLNHLQDNMRLMAHINSSQTRMANLEQKLTELGELFLVAMRQSSLDQGTLDQQLQPSLYKSCVNNPEHIYKTSLLT